jgi:hypothetical protein
MCCLLYKESQVAIIVGECVDLDFFSDIERHDYFAGRAIAREVIIFSIVGKYFKNFLADVV